MQTHTIVILTREQGDNEILAEKLFARGIPVLQYPCITTTILPFGQEAHLPPQTRLEDFQVIVFTSKRGVSGLSPTFSQLAASPQKIAVVGNSTAQAVTAAIGRKPDFIAEPATGESLARMLVQQLYKEDRILHVRGDKSTGQFKKILEENQFQVTELEVYRNDSPKLNPIVPMDHALVVFASPSAARHFFLANLKNPMLQKWSYVAIGPTTASYLKKIGLSHIHVAKKPDVDGLIEMILKILSEKNK